MSQVEHPRLMFHAAKRDGVRLLAMTSRTIWLAALMCLCLLPAPQDAAAALSRSTTTAPAHSAAARRARSALASVTISPAGSPPFLSMEWLPRYRVRTLNCGDSASAKGQDFAYTWFVNTTNSTAIGRGQALRLFPTGVQDTGLYICQVQGKVRDAQNKLVAYSNTLSQKITVFATTAALKCGLAPRFTSPLLARTPADPCPAVYRTAVSLVVGQTFTIDCSVMGYTGKTLLVEFIDKKGNSHLQDAMVLAGVRADDAGIYKCRAHSTNYDILAVFTINVSQPTTAAPSQPATTQQPTTTATTTTTTTTVATTTQQPARTPTDDRSDGAIGHLSLVVIISPAATCVFVLVVACLAVAYVKASRHTGRTLPADASSRRTALPIASGNFDPAYAHEMYGKPGGTRV